MPLKLIGTIFLLVLVTIFAGFNIENKCNINLIFRQFENVPIFFSLMCSFVVGVVVTLPFTIGKSKKVSKKSKEQKLPDGDAKKILKAEEKAKKVSGRKGTVAEAEKSDKDNKSDVESVIPL